MLTNLEVEAETNKAINVSSLDGCLNLEPHSQKYSLHTCSLMIGHQVLRLKKKKESQSNKRKGGRVQNPTCLFVNDSKPEEENHHHVQVMNQKLR